MRFQTSFFKNRSAETVQTRIITEFITYLQKISDHFQNRMDTKKYRIFRGI